MPINFIFGVDVVSFGQRFTWKSRGSAGIRWIGGLAYRESAVLLELESQGGWLEQEFDNVPKSVEMR